MFSNRLAVVVLGLACVTAAAAGGFIAAHQSSAPAPAAAQSQNAESTAAVPSNPEAPATARPVQETEAVVGDSVAKPSAPAAPAAAAPASSKPARSSAKSASSVAAPVKSRHAGSQPTARPERPSSSSPRETAKATRQDPPPLASSWPSSSSSSTPANSGSTSTDNPTATRSDERTTQQETARTPDPPQKTFEELVVSKDSVIGLQTETKLSSETAKVEDRVEARVTRDVRVGDRIAIPAGSHAIGSVMQVERGGKFKERARLGIRFNELVLADGTRLPITTETIYRDGEAPGNTSAAKVGGGAVGGAILGAILGGAKGAAIGATAGAGGGTAAVMAGGRSEVVLPPGTPMTVRIVSPVTITSEKE